MGRIIQLEACRGIAASAVVLVHIRAAFDPTFPHSFFPSGTIFDLLFGFFNATGAVIFFFVLSGYVLTAKFFQNPDPNLIARAVFKRLPRLAGITTIVTLISALLWLSGLYYFRSAAELSGSSWLASFGGNAELADSFEPSIASAIAQGSWRTFIVGDSYLDSSLWTMKHEFHGSFLVFLAAPFFVYVLRGRFIWLSLLFGVVVFRYTDPYMIPFLCGLGIAYFERSYKIPHSPWLTLVLLTVGLYLLGFADDRVFDFLPAFWGYRVGIFSVGATLVIIAILRSPMAERVLNNKIGALLGRLSFPIYLIHVPVILSASSAAYVSMFGLLGRAAMYPAALCTVVVTLAAALPLAKFDIAWVRFLNSKFVLWPLAPVTAKIIDADKPVRQLPRQTRADVGTA
jgi:peptidoglycan/LPS O-acetylase OafA/YrhL